MKYRFLLTSILWLSLQLLWAQYPGGVSTGTVRGYKVDYYNGTFSNQTQFGVGTSNVTPSLTGYSNKVTASEFASIDNSYYGIEYLGILEIPTEGSYTFTFNSVDDRAWLYIDDVLIIQAIVSSASGTVTLTAGDHRIKVKYYALATPNAISSLRFTGPGITTAADVDGRFVRYEGVKLSGWYNASNLSVTANFNGTGINKVNGWTNLAPDYTGSGNMSYAGSSSGSNSQQYATQNLVNYNPSVRFDGDDRFYASSSQKGLSYRGATKTMFTVATFNAAGASLTAQWMFLHGKNSANTVIGLWKGSNSSQLAVQGNGSSNSSAYTALEPKVLSGYVDQATGVSAPSGTNPLTLNANGTGGTPAQVFSNVTAAANEGLQIGTGFDNLMNESYMTEAIYYPFKLSTVEEQKVNTYLAVKYGATLNTNYLNTSGSTIFSLTTNVGYTNRIFGIGRELVAEGLNQKQSQSQMISATGYSFLVISKGAIATTNAANTGALNDGDYVLVGDNGGALAAQTTEIPSSITSSSCTANRIGREWKAQVTGVPGAVTIRAGSSTAGSFLFPPSAAGIKLMVDIDGDGDFTTGTVNTYDATSVVNGVATFNNVSIANGNVFTFVWSVTAPGGVLSGLTHWYNNNLGTYSDAASNVPAVEGSTFGSWTNAINLSYAKITPGSTLTPTPTNAIYNASRVNFNPAWGFNNMVVYTTAFTPSINSPSVTAFLAVVPQAGTNSVHRRLVIKNVTQSNDWDNLAGMTFFGENAGNRIIVYRNSTTLANIATVPYGIPTVLSSVHSNTATSLFNNGIAGTSNSYSFASNLNSNQVFMGGSYAVSDGGWSNASNGMEYYTEAAIYNRSLSATERRQVETYLSIKNGTTLGIASGALYLASDGTTNVYNKTAYPNNIFGIGRDDCSGLSQRQSKSTASGDNVTIGLVAVAASNAANTGSFSTNKQFIMIGNDGGALSSTTTNIPTNYISCNSYRYIRNWIVQNTGNITNSIQMTVGDATNPIANNWLNVTLAVNTAGNNTFPAASTILYPAVNSNAGVATFNNVLLPDGAVFTVLYTLAYPGGVSAPSSAITIGGLKYSNGLTYNFYSVTNTSTGNISLATSFNTLNPTLQSTGYFPNATSFHGFVLNKLSDNFAVELIGKLYIATASSTYQFRAVAPDDRFALVIDGVTVIDRQSFITATDATSINVSLTAGYHDIRIVGQDTSGSQNFNLQWNGGSGTTFSAIPDANFFTTFNGPSAWYESDDNGFFSNADGAALTGTSTWKDLSFNANNLTNEAVGTTTYYKTNTAYMTNYNPIVYFSDGKYSLTATYATGLPYGTQSRSLIGVASIYATTGNELLTGYGVDNSSGYSGFAVGKSSTQRLTAFGSWNATVTTVSPGNVFYSGTTPVNHILQYDYSNSTFSTYGDMLSLGSATQLWGGNMNDNKQLTVGNGPDGANANGWNGNISEIIYYPWQLTATDRQKVNSYLALKWGLTLDQTTATNYLASDGTVIWNATTAGVYKNDITGIGRDDCGNLNQKQSTSTDGNDIVSIGLGQLAANNPMNTNSFSADKTFLIFAHNGSAFTNKTTTNLPASLGNCYYRLQREWQVQIKGTPGSVSMEFGKKDLYTINATTYKPVILISNTAGDYTNATVVKHSRILFGKAYFNNITLTDGQYFTLAYVDAAPGGVNTNMTVWFNSDYDSFTDVAQTTYAISDGDKVASMNNIKFGAAFTRVEQSNTTYQPIYYKAFFNYNAGISFLGSGQTVLAAPSNIATTDYRTTSSMTSILAGYNTGTGSSQNVFWYTGSGTGTDKTAMERPQVFWGSATSLPRTPALTSPEIYTFAASTASGYRLYSNLKTVGSGSIAATTNISAPFYIGNNSAAGGGGTAGAAFYLGEFVIYSDDKGSANALDMKKIHSYMAIKYGFTLDNASIGGSYITSDGTVTYNDANYWNCITGIGMDNCSALEQKQSFSQVAGALVKISNDPNGLATSNDDNTAYFNTDKSFLVFGDNNKSLTWTGVDNITNSSGISLSRLNRVWHVKETGVVDTVYLQVPSSSSSATTKLPNVGTNPIYLVVTGNSSNGSFKSTKATIEMVPSGTDLYVTYDFADGDYYSFATLTSCATGVSGPAGITDGLTTWYKATDLSLGAITPTSGTLSDLYGTNTLTRNASGTATVTAGSASSLNYNSYIALLGNAALQTTGNLTEASITAANQGSLYGVALGTNNDGLFGLSRSSYNGPGIFNNPTWANVATVSYGGSAIANNANFWSVIKDPTTIYAGTNGVLNSLADATTVATNSTYALRVGSKYSGTTQVFTNNNFAEAFSFNRALTTAEQQVLNSYLAIKYGKTITHNYYSPNYNGSNGSTETLYDITTYANRIFGVGNDMGGCFYQNQSISPLVGSMLKISVDGVINTVNSRDASKWTVNQTYLVIGDDNGNLQWVHANIPKIESGNKCLYRIGRQWKATVHNQVPEVLITIPDNTSTATTKLDAVPVNNDVYLVISDNQDFTATSATQRIFKMTLNNTTKEWEAKVVFNPEDFNTTRYITFIYKPALCGSPSVPINPSTTRARLKQ